jgi:hypothetical protein
MRGTPFIVSPPGNVRIRRMASRRGLGLRGKFDLRDDDHRFPTPRTYRGGRPRAPAGATQHPGFRRPLGDAQLRGRPRSFAWQPTAAPGLPTQAGPESRAETVTDRLLQLRQRRVERLCLVIPGCKPVTPEGQGTGDHEPPGFANAGRWRLVTAGGRQPEAWRASLTVADRNAAKNRIWAVHYEGEPAGEVIPQRPDLRAAGEQLRKSLRFASEFRSQSRPGHMGSLVRPCPGQQQRHPYHPDMRAAGSSVPIRGGLPLFPIVRTYTACAPPMSRAMSDG